MQSSGITSTASFVGVGSEVHEKHPATQDDAWPSVAGHCELEDQPSLYGEKDTRVADAWADVLRRYPAHVFATLTFRREKFYTDKQTRKIIAVNRTGSNGSMHPEAADKAFRFFVSNINRELYGPKWSSRWHGGLQWARGQEFHKDGRLHFHALISAPSEDLNNLISRYRWHEWWYREFGRNQLEEPRSQQEVAAYVSKYVAKGGEVDFSRNFGAWVPPVPSRWATPQQTNLAGFSTTNSAPRTDASIAQERAPRERNPEGVPLA